MLHVCRGPHVSAQFGLLMIILFLTPFEVGFLPSRLDGLFVLNRLFDLLFAIDSTPRCRPRTSDYTAARRLCAAALTPTRRCVSAQWASPSSPLTRRASLAPPPQAAPPPASPRAYSTDPRPHLLTSRPVLSRRAPSKATSG